MGCWNGTCALSGLYVHAGTPIYVFLMSPTPYHDRCYTTALFEPLIVPFEAEYNDYGAGENCSGAALNPIIAAIRDNLVEKDVGKNQYHDIAVKKEGFNVEQLFEAMHEDRLRIEKQTFSGDDEVPVDAAMVRKDVFEYAATNYVFERYVGEEKGTTGWNNSYITFTYADVVASVPAFFDRLVADITEIRSLNPNDFRSFKLFNGLSSMCDFQSNNLAEQWATHLDSSSHNRCPHWFNLSRMIVDLIGDGKRQNAEDLFRAYLVGQMVDVLMTSTRRVWTPTMHQGSQDDDHRGYRAINLAVEQCLVDRERELGDEEY